jgi:hypothetical protein
MKMYLVCLIALSFVNSVHASFSVEESLQTPPPAYQYPPSYKASKTVSSVIQEIIINDFLQRLHILKKNNPENSKYHRWTVKDYETELRSYTLDQKLVLSDIVNQSIAIRLHNIQFHNQLHVNIYDLWQNIAESLQISDNSIHAVHEKLQNYQ